MSEPLQEYVDSGSQRLRVDRDGGRHSRRQAAGPRVAQWPPVSRERARRRDRLCTKARRSTSIIPRAIRCRRAIIRTGWASCAACSFAPAKGCSAICTSTRKHALSEQLVWDAEHAPQNVGMSHNVLARTKRERRRDGRRGDHEGAEHRPGGRPGHDERVVRAGGGSRVEGRGSRARNR